MVGIYEKVLHKEMTLEVTVSYCRSGFKENILQFVCTGVMLGGKSQFRPVNRELLHRLKQYSGD